MTTQQQEDGVYPRVNSATIQDCYGKIVSVIGSLVSFDGTNLTLKCADGGDISVVVNDPNFEFEQANVVEIIGTLTQEQSLESFVIRMLGNDFDLDLYNQLITKIMNTDNQSCNEYFLPK